MNAPTLLPQNRGAFEKTADETGARIAAVPVPLRLLARPDAAPLAILPWLAWALSVDVWDDAWPEERKRAVIARSIALHRKKGTLWAISEYAGYAGSTLRRAIVPPDVFFAGKATTPAERAAWLAKLPQIRIYPFRSRGQQDYGAYARGGFHLAKAFLGAGASAVPPSGGAADSGTFFPRITDAAARYGKRAFLYQDGAETPLKWSEHNTAIEATSPRYERVRLPGTVAGGFFLGQVPRPPFVVKRSTAASRIYTVDLGRFVTEFDTHLYGVPASLEPISTVAGFTRQGGTAFGLFAGSCLKGQLVASDAWMRLYDRVHLHDGARPELSRRRRAFLGNVRLGMPPYHARLDIEVPGREPFHRFGRYVHGFAVAGDRRRLDNTVAAVRSAKSARDKILIRTRLHRSPRVGDPIHVGGVTLGGQIRDY